MALQYELFYLVGESKEQSLPAIKTEVEKIVTAEGGTFHESEMEERRKLAYPIKKETRGVYVTRRFSLPNADERKKSDSPEAIAKISRLLHLYRDVLRFIIVRSEGMPALGEREVVPQIPNRDSRRRDTRNDRPVFSAPRTPAREAVKPAEKQSAPVAETPSPEAPIVEEIPAVNEAPVTETSTVEEAVVTKSAKEKKPAKKSAKKKEAVQEEEIDKKLDEILNI